MQGCSGIVMPPERSMGKVVCKLAYHCQLEPKPILRSSSCGTLLLDGSSFLISLYNASLNGSAANECNICALYTAWRWSRCALGNLCYFRQEEQQKQK